MTDRSNYYGPVRRQSPSLSSDRKPYSRSGLKGVLGTLDLNSGDTAVSTPSDSPYYPFHAETPQLEAPTQNRTSVPDGPRDIVGFPSYEQFQRIEGEYLSSLSERKQPKALISQALFDKILAVLQNGSEDRGSTAQFRFWVRKMFVLTYPQTTFNRNAGQTPEPVVLHDKRPVAIKEQIYEVLCYCHAVARHGGRDKTCATLRLNYSWVPKELTAKFVKACPTCTLKRSGNPDLLSHFGSSSRSSSPYAPPLSSPAEPASLPVFPGGPNDPPSPQGLSFVVGSDIPDDGGGASADFGPSMFATPDLSVYPSPTLSTVSLGPTTPSPYLPSGLFGYPTVFDPGHNGSLTSVVEWDTASAFSPCGLMYPEEFELHAGISEQRQEAQVSAEDMQLHLPSSMQKVTHPSGARGHGDDCDNGDGGDGRCSAEPLPRIVGTDMSDIDPALIEGRYSPFAFVVGPSRTATDDAERDMENNPGTGGERGGSSGPFLHIPNRNLPESSSSNLNCVSQIRIFHQRQHHYHHQQHAYALPPPGPQLGLALGSTASTAGMGCADPASTSGPPRLGRRGLRQLLSLSTHDASSGTRTRARTETGDACSGSVSQSASFNRDNRDRDVPESLLSLSSPPGANASSNESAAPRGASANASDSYPLMNMMMLNFASPAASPTTPTPTGGFLGTARGTECAQEQEQCHRLQLRPQRGDASDTESAGAPGVNANFKEATASVAARCRCNCPWDSPDAWLVQSDSVDEDVSGAAVA